MKVKAVDIARKLGISKATVSLALNNKPGVNPKTKEQIFECKRRLENCEIDFRDESRIFEKKGDTIKIVIMDAGANISINAELDLWTDVCAVFNQVAKSWGCKLDISYFDVKNDTKEGLGAICNKEDVLGVIIMATELISGDGSLLHEIDKPLIVYDADVGGRKYSSVMINNADGIRNAMEYLFSKEKKNVVYLAMDDEIYNFISRRQGYTDFLREHNVRLDDVQIVTVGKSIASIYKKLGAYLDRNQLPDAFIGESYHISVAAIRLFHDRGIRLKDDVSFIGVDELPDYLTGGHALTTVKVPHTERARLAMNLLKHEIDESPSSKSKIFTNCKLIEGDTA
ncbi:MAG: LacI family transcriptional regulator [Lachnospiraceae bacterium]|nr:LacI family transcriptional regulator [Lachnospiraceae bacterium]